jgi:hypothetical protein
LTTHTDFPRQAWCLLAIVGLAVTAWATALAAHLA